MDTGILTVYTLQNVAEPGYMPCEKLVECCTAYYSEQTVGVTRAYMAIGANQRIDMLVRCYNADIPRNAEYVVLEDGLQYRISLKQKVDDSVDLTLERLDDNYDVEE